MKNFSVDLNTSGETSWLTFSAEISADEVDAVRGSWTQHLAEASDGTLWLLNVPLGVESH